MVALKLLHWVAVASLPLFLERTPVTGLKTSQLPVRVALLWVLFFFVWQVAPLVDVAFCAPASPLSSQPCHSHCQTWRQLGLQKGTDSIKQKTLLCTHWLHFLLDLMSDNVMQLTLHTSCNFEHKIVLQTETAMIADHVVLLQHQAK